MGTDAGADVPVLGRDLDPSVAVDAIDAPSVWADASSEYLVGGLFGGVRRENPLYTARLAEAVAGRPRWRKVCDVEDEVVSFAFKGDDLFLLTTRNAPNGRLIRTSMAQPDLASAGVVLPEGRAVIEGVATAKDALYVADFEGGYGGLRRLGYDGAVSPVTLPFRGSIFGLGTETTRDGALMSLGSWLRPSSVWSYEHGSGMQQTGLSSIPRIDVAPYEATQLFAEAADGVKVPVSIVARKGLRRDGSHPTIVNAYGAYQDVNRPGFDARSIAFLERGGVVATAHVRGGGEYGKTWWQAGHKQTKPNTWRDLIAVSEFLVREGWTSPRRLAIDGASAGGIAVGMALAERPDLFAVVIGRVGTFNLLRTEFAPNGPNNVVRVRQRRR